MSEVTREQINDRIEELKSGVDYPATYRKPSLVTIYSGYIGIDETPNSRIMDIAHNVAKIHGKPDLFDAVYGFVAKENAFSFSSPIWSNFGSSNKKALPISCFNTYIPDSVDGMYDRLRENAIMTKAGGGTSSYWGDVRSAGEDIDGGGKTTGTLSFMESYEAMIKRVSQGGVRRGMHVVYIDIDHGDYFEFMNIRNPSSPIQKMTHAVCVSNKFIDRYYSGDEDALERWALLMERRNDHGLPYIFYTDNANNGESTPKCYGIHSKGKYPINGSNLCNEIMLPSWMDESFVCCLLSMNLLTFDEWENKYINGYGAVETAVYVLDAVMTEFISKTDDVDAMTRSNRFARRHRALGIGVFGWHDYLQSNGIPFAGIQANSLTRNIFSGIREKALRTSAKMADEYGACEVNKEFDIHRRHTTVMAMAPTTTNALIAGGLSQGIEPHASNCYLKTVAKGEFMFKNKTLEALLESKGKNTEDVWKSIRTQNGSVAFLDFLSDEEKEVFKTFSEINQFDLIEQAAIRQKYIDQGQALNIFIPPEAPSEVRSKLHLAAHAYGIKGLYYQRSFSQAQIFMAEGISAEDSDKTGFEHIRWENSMDMECTSCEG